MNLHRAVLSAEQIKQLDFGLISRQAYASRMHMAVLTGLAFEVRANTSGLKQNVCGKNTDPGGVMRVGAQSDQTMHPILSSIDGTPRQ
jgi:hypothetical protein